MKITIEGQKHKLAPADLSAAELGVFISKLASLTEKIGGADSAIAVTAIEDNCISLQVLAKTEAAQKALARFLAAHLAVGVITLPAACNEEIRYFNNFCRNHSASVSFMDTEKNQTLTVSEKTQLRQAEKPSPMKYETVIYGEVIDVGGMTPNVHLECVGHGRVKGNLSRDLAIQLASRLYQMVGLKGTATEEDGAITDFHVAGLTPYCPVPGTDPCAGLRELEKQYGCFNDVDAAEYVKGLRG